MVPVGSSLVWFGLVWEWSHLVCIGRFLRSTVPPLVLPGRAVEGGGGWEGERWEGSVDSASFLAASLRIIFTHTHTHTHRM